MRRVVLAMLIGLALALPLLVYPAVAEQLWVDGKIRTWAPENSASTHRPSLEQAREDAASFDLITALKGAYADHVGEMKQVNPDLVLVSYMNGTLAQSHEGDSFPDDWYLRDAAGAKVRSKSWGNYLMNPAHPGWIQNRAEQANEFLERSGYDGVILDVMGTAPLSTNYSSGAPINPATGAQWSRNEWLQATSSLGAAVKQAVGSSPVLVNGLGNGRRYYMKGEPASQLLDGVDGGHAEAWLRNAWRPIDNYPNLASWKKDIDLLVDASARDKIVLARTKVWSQGTQDQKDAWHRFAYTSFLLGASENTYFKFSYSPDDDPTAAQPLWSTRVGSPLGGYRELDSGAYRRDFSESVVVVNPTSSPVEVDPGPNLLDSAGNGVDRTTLAPYSGEVFFRP